MFVSPEGIGAKRCRNRGSNETGMTLVLVLIMLVLLLGVVLSIFSTAQSERQLSSQFASVAHARRLAEMAVNTCIAQITDGTSGPDRAWVSQPGLIRTFTGNREPDVNYRLYSWKEMTPKGAFDPFSTANLVPSDWKEKTSLYIDLNEPMADLGDPQDRSRDKYPILYPKSLTASGSGAGTLNVAGYEVAAPPGGIGAADNPVPMPVQWLYVLRDGSLEAVSAVDGNKVTIDAANSANPIVGRIAFWADDETTKVNVNTAAGGAFWSEPRFDTREERPNGLGFGWTQPVKNEYQRYPGHPARTDLRAVFPELSLNEIYKLVPKIEQGGSENGTKPFIQDAIVPDLDRLYSGIGEMRFAATTGGTTNRLLQKSSFSAFSGGTEDRWDEMLEKRKAFVTTTSRAPELTLFGTPRVSLWPISESADPNRHTALDRLLGFCSTVTSGPNHYPFYFTRLNPRSTTEDVNLSRNQNLLGYLQRLTGRAVPGLSDTSFEGKYGGWERNQILTEVFDYIRITNLQDMQLSSSRVYASDAVVFPTEWTPAAGQPTRGFGRAYSLRQVGFIFICNADAANPSSNTEDNKALGGNLLLAEERSVQALFFVELFSPSAGLKMMNAAPRIKVLGLEDMELSSDGTPAKAMGFVNDPFGSTAPGVGTASYSGGFGANGGAVNYRWLYMEKNAASVQTARDVRTTGALTSDDTTAWPYVSMPVTLKYAPGATNPTMKIGAGEITVQIFLGNGDTMINEIKVNLDEVEIPMPRLHDTKEYWAFQKSGYDGASTGRFSRAATKIDNPTHDPGVPLITRFDSVQSYILPHGDYRHLFSSVDDIKAFVPAPPGADLAHRHFLSENNQIVYGSNLTTAFADGFTSRVQFGAVMHPGAYPAGLNKPWDLGDWDTASSMVMTDGPLINKVDEGSIYLMTPTSVTNPYRTEYSLAGGGENSYATAGGYHSANRQVPSAVMLGSLPTGMISGKAWQTLLFRPTEAAHPGKNDPPDHLLLDLFWMPVVEPYAVSEPFSTAGKINMNYQMIPFTYIERSTGVRAVLMNEKVLAVPDSAMAGGYRKIGNASAGDFNLGIAIDVEQTLQPFRDRFSNGDVFITPGEITQIHLVPEGMAYANMPAFWQSHRLTGDNLKERPYAHIYPRLTTKSNVFNVHHRVQVLRKKPGSPASEWDENSDKVVAEARGNTVIERYIDVNRTGIVDFATESTANAEALYRFRVLARKDFKP